jgi:hypothetical protein
VHGGTNLLDWHSEVSLHDLNEHGWFTPPVTGTGGQEQYLAAKQTTTTPISTFPTNTWVPDDPPVHTSAHCIDTRSTYNCCATALDTLHERKYVVFHEQTA